MTVCERKYKEVEDFITNNPEVMDGPEHPDCRSDGSFNPKQCLSFTGACWCVNADTGVMVEGTLRMPEEDFNSPIDCEGRVGFYFTTSAVENKVTIALLINHKTHMP